MILRIVTSVELVNDDGTVSEPRTGFKVGTTASVVHPIETERAAARLLSEVMVESMEQVVERWTKKDGNDADS